MILALEEFAPRVAADAWVAPSAVVVGDVAIGALSSVWFGAVVRGDINAIRIGARSNVQDNAVLHVARGDGACLVEDDVLIGHAAIVHACYLRSGAFVGMGAIVLNGAVIEAGGMLGAGALLTGGKRIGPGELWTGSPARLARVLSGDELAANARMVASYVDNARRFRTGLRDPA